MLNKNLRVGVVGDLMIDINYFCSQKGISQENFRPILSINKSIFYPGGAANLAKNLSLLGCKTQLFGFIANDFNGKQLRSLISENIDSSNLIINFSPAVFTTTKLRVFLNNRQIERIDNDYYLKNKLIRKKVFSKIFYNFSKLDAIIISDYDKGVIDSVNIQSIIKKCLKYKKRIYVDPKFKNWKIYRNSFFIKPNLKEMEKACNKSNLSQSEIFKEAEKMLKLYNFNYILITMGEKGMILVSKNEKFHIKSTKRINANIVGAGDVVMASVVRFYESFKDMKKAIILSDIAAGIGISKIGTSTASLNEIEKNSKKIAFF